MGRRPDNHHDVDNYYDSRSNHDDNCSFDVADCNDCPIRVDNDNCSASSVNHQHIDNHFHHHDDDYPTDNHNQRTSC